MIPDGLELYPIRVPLRMRFRRVEHRDAVLIKGPCGWGEFSPFDEYPLDVAGRWLAAAVELACREMPTQRREVIPVNVTVPAVGPDVAHSMVGVSGATTAKVKIGDHSRSEAEDLARVKAVREALGPHGHIRVDVNAAWSVETAARRLEGLAAYGIQYVEQPVATIEEMVELRSKTPIPLAADELVRQSSDPLEVVEQGGADVLILKVQPMGGVAEVLDLAARSTVPVVISSALETSIGMYGGLAAAAALPDLDFACGLGTVSLMADDPTSEPLVPQNGLLKVRRPEPSDDLLERLKPPDSVSDQMLDRLSAAAEFLV